MTAQGVVSYAACFGWSLEILESRETHVLEILKGARNIIATKETKRNQDVALSELGNTFRRRSVENVDDEIIIEDQYCYYLQNDALAAHTWQVVDSSSLQVTHWESHFRPNAFFSLLSRGIQQI